MTASVKRKITRDLSLTDAGARMPHLMPESVNKKERIFVRLTPPERDALEKRAIAEDRPMSGVMRRALRSYLKLPINEMPVQEPRHHPEVIRMGEYWRDLPPNIRQHVVTYAEALRKLCGTEREPLDVGREAFEGATDQSPRRKDARKKRKGNS